MAPNNYVQWFRHASPYIRMHRGKTFVVALEGEVIAHHNFLNIIRDLVLLNSLGVRLVLVYGARVQIDSELAEQQLSSTFYHNDRVTDDITLAIVKQIVGGLGIDIEAALSSCPVNLSMNSAAPLRVCRGNFTVAKPLGVVNGIDYHYTGKVRRMDVEGVVKQLNLGSIVLLDPLAYSLSGEVFNVGLVDIATSTAIALKADKLIFFSSHQGVENEQGILLKELTTNNLEKLIAQKSNRAEDSSWLQYLNAAVKVCNESVKRAHFISYLEEGALVKELFTNEGSGTLVTQERYERVMSATIDDVAAIVNLIQPLEENGTLVRRSRELLENEIQHFIIMQRDGLVIGCAALYPYLDHQQGELACVAIHPDFQGEYRGDLLLAEIENKARSLGIKSIFVLTTLTAHWFQERGFKEAALESLPEERQALYNFQRNSKLFIKPI